MESNASQSGSEASPRFHFASEKAPEAFGASASASDAGNGHGASTDGPSPAEALKQASSKLGELKEYASLLVAAKVDGLKLTLRTIVFYSILGVVAAVVGVTMLVTASVYVLSGVAGAIGQLFPAPYEWWAGRLIVGVLVVGGTLVGVMLLSKSLTGSSRKRTIEKYENRKRDARKLYGHDAAERARQQRQANGA